MRRGACNRRHNLHSMSSALWLHVLFFGSGVSGLIYQVVWVRQFGQIFGNTVYSAWIVVAIFMLGLGAGSYVFGVLADRPASGLRRGGRAPATPMASCVCMRGSNSSLACLALTISFALPHLSRDRGESVVVRGGQVDGWQTLSTASYALRAAIAMLLLGPVAVLMGGTLTVLVRARSAGISMPAGGASRRCTA